MRLKLTQAASNHIVEAYSFSAAPKLHFIVSSLSLLFSLSYFGGTRGVPMRILPVYRGVLLGFSLSLLLFTASFCHADEKAVEVVGIGECTDCAENNVKSSHAFSGTIFFLVLYDMFLNLLWVHCLVSQLKFDHVVRILARALPEMLFADPGFCPSSVFVCVHAWDNERQRQRPYCISILGGYDRQYYKIFRGPLKLQSKLSITVRVTPFNQI